MGQGNWGREFVNRRYQGATEKRAAEAERVRKGGQKRPKRFLAGPYDGDPLSIDWLNCGCGYVRPTSNGKPVPQYADPAYANWTEVNQRRSSKSSLHSAIRELCKTVYPVGYHHNVVPLGTDPGFPDLTLWGRGEGNIIFREEKSMKGRLEEGQAEHLFSLHQLGFDAAVWKPCCLLSGRIELELASLAGVRPQGRGALRQKGLAPAALSWEDVAAGALNDDD